MEFNWVEKRLPVSHFLFSGFFIVIQISSLVYWILFFLALPLFFIAIYLLFFNKSSYSIRFTDSFISIRSRLLSRTKTFDLKELSGVYIVFTKSKDGFYDGSENKHSYTTSLYYTIKITSMINQYTYRFKKNWTVSRLKPKERQFKAIQKRYEFETHIKCLKDFLPDLIEIQDIAPDPKIVRQANYVILFIEILIILGIYVQYLEGNVDGLIPGVIFVLVLSICLLLPQRKYKKYSDAKYLLIGLDEKDTIIS